MIYVRKKIFNSLVDAKKLKILRKNKIEFFSVKQIYLTSRIWLPQNMLSNKCTLYIVVFTKKNTRYSDCA